MISNKEVNKIFDDVFNGNENFIRVDNTHCLDLYIGYSDNDRLTLFYKTKEKPANSVVSSLINVCVGKRKDGYWAIRFVLLNNYYRDLFCYFCADIIESSRNIKDDKLGSKFIIERYSKWRKLFEKGSDFNLSESEVKGLIGELYFLKEYLIKKYGVEKAILSWIGPSKTKQDFVLENTWYEVKSTVSGADTLKISSVEQLDMSNDGHLVVLYLDKTSVLDSSRLTLNSLVSEIKNELEDFMILNWFESKLLEIGYYHNDKYDEYNFKHKKTDIYIVDKDFPCMRRIELPKSICNVKYELVISDLEGWRV